MRRILIYQLLIALSVSFNFFYSNAQEVNQADMPNIILIMADDLGYGDVGFNGNDVIITPHLDGMSKKGITLTSFYAAAPLCSPTRASVLTGRSPFRQGIFAAHTAGMRPAEKTIAEILKQQGYKTGFFGKWHMGWLQPDKVESRGVYSPPWHHGYEETFATKSAVPTWNPTKTPKGWNSWGAKADGSWGGSIYIENGKPVTKNLDGDDSRVIMDRVIPFIENSIENKAPFFATVWFHAPHEPVVAGPEYLAKYPNLPKAKKHLYGCITAMDEQIGRLNTFLKNNNIDENTLIFFCSDNGPSDPLAKRGIASAGPFRGHKHQMWEGGLRVPSLIYWPGHIKKGTVSNAQTSTNDYFPTILDLLNIKPNKKVPLDGISLKPLINGDVNIDKNPVAFGYQRLYKKTELYAYINGQYKICIPEVGDDMMLFDLENDPAETNNLALEKPELFKKMCLELEKIKMSWKASREGKDYQW
ncbi:arylsulfatase A-like enzyme [Jejuia pallidilutea]|uniref:Arylsulfatase A-like enzyme n=1 Tax=Jejuia pallidilutea TaxID=504487 RepID=A0A362X6U4_9FLAO|nr:sulfatase-like hydrolase/transferase [Jejuia pallidilutea]PQV51173.1 arylsulfatase A-like enzyme [Jejuia pallidilutea]